MDIEELTPQEMLIIDRRRNGLNQKEAAKKFNVSLTTYSRWERGIVPFNRNICNKVRFSQLSAREKCFIYRKRCNMTLWDVAKQLKLSKYYVNLMELGKVDCDVLIWFWEQ